MIDVGPPTGLTTVMVPSTAAARCTSPRSPLPPAGAPAGGPLSAAGQSILSAEHLDVGFGEPGVARAVVGSGLYLAVIGLLGLGRDRAGAQQRRRGRGPVRDAVRAADRRGSPAGGHRGLGEQVPAGPGRVRAHPRPPDAFSLAPWAGFGLLCGSVAVLLALAARRLRRRDT
ncbi:hypothetical protein BBK14_29195 [Parafrankia soli]|uniref:Uncharacterized protein n=1 Tax=Parafrankia soli TaxID=2599596 RepID=A0A1S1PEL6_9ACTN|nr:hypothetical protein [Parafrankia soli]OHV19589.1 hypothetical protein BBK14_29195 [Parafrankia soli]